MATVDEKQYEIKQRVVYGMYLEEKLHYVGVATANVDNIFVGLYKESVRGIIIYPEELKEDAKKARCVVLHIMADDKNNCKDSVAMARLIAEQKKPVHPFCTKDMRAMFLHLALREY